MYVHKTHYHDKRVEVLIFSPLAYSRCSQVLYNDKNKCANPPIILFSRCLDNHHDIKKLGVAYVSF